MQQMGALFVGWALLAAVVVHAEEGPPCSGVEVPIEPGKSLPLLSMSAGVYAGTFRGAPALMWNGMSVAYDDDDETPSTTYLNVVMRPDTPVTIDGESLPTSELQKRMPGGSGAVDAHVFGRVERVVDAGCNDLDLKLVGELARSTGGEMLTLYLIEGRIEFHDKDAVFDRLNQQEAAGAPPPSPAATTATSAAPPPAAPAAPPPPTASALPAPEVAAVDASPDVFQWIVGDDLPESLVYAGVGLHPIPGAVLDAQTQLQVVTDRFQLRFGPAMLMVDDVVAGLAQMYFGPAFLNVPSMRLRVGGAVGGLGAGFFVANVAADAFAPDAGIYVLVSRAISLGEMTLRPGVLVDVGPALSPFLAGVVVRAEGQLQGDIVSGVGAFVRAGTDVRHMFGNSGGNTTTGLSLSAGVTFTLDALDLGCCDTMCDD